jgi:hypothetical protein
MVLGGPTGEWSRARPSTFDGVQKGSGGGLHPGFSRLQALPVPESDFPGSPSPSVSFRILALSFLALSFLLEGSPRVLRPLSCRYRLVS